MSKLTEVIAEVIHINAKLQSKFLKVIDGIEVTCDLSVKAK